MLVVLALLVALTQSVSAQGAQPSELLAQGKGELAANHLIKADELFQQVIDHPDSNSSTVEEALFWQIKLYYGDVFGAALLMAPVGVSYDGPAKMKAEIGQQMLLARRAFDMAGRRYLNATALGSDMDRVQASLPAFSDADLKQLEATLQDIGAVGMIVTAYETDASAGKGLMAQANRFGLYLGMGNEVPKSPQRKMQDISRLVAGGSNFNYLEFLDWMATVSIELNGLVQEPGGPKLLDLSERCDERLRGLAPAGSLYMNNAAERDGQR